MNLFTILQSSEEFVDKSAEMAESDPHGVIITVVSVSVVFVSLILLYFAYTLIGKAVNSKIIQPAQNEHKEETAVDESIHDDESYVITINRKKGTLKSLTPAIRQSATAATEETSASNSPARASSAGKNVTAPLPGVIIAIKVKAGDTVKAGQTVAVLEAMKMENDILAEHDGTVRSIEVEKGDTVLEGALIITIG